MFTSRVFDFFHCVLLSELAAEDTKMNGRGTLVGFGCIWFAKEFVRVSQIQAFPTSPTIMDKTN
jgi:hypothetical protein